VQGVNPLDAVHIAVVALRLGAYGQRVAVSWKPTARDGDQHSPERAVSRGWNSERPCPWPLPALPGRSGRRVTLELEVRRFCCDQAVWGRRTFGERFPPLVGERQRQTVRLQQALEQIGYALGGEAGARLARHLSILVSPDTILRRLPRPARPPLRHAPGGPGATAPRGFAAGPPGADGSGVADTPPECGDYQP
jgi:hypothetical protein